jgi:hypothetical protein
MKHRGSCFLPGLAAALGLALAHSAPAQQEPQVVSAVQYLRGRALHQQVGETAMIALALLKADVPATDPVVAGCLATIQKRFTASGYSPQRIGGHDVYEAAVVAIALANFEAEVHRGELGLLASYLIGRQNANGASLNEAQARS